MGFNIKDRVNRIFNSTQSRDNVLKSKISNSYGMNPFLNNKGQLINPYINYQKFLDNGQTSEKTKGFITQATGFTPRVSTVMMQSNAENAKRSNTGTSNLSIVESAKSYLGTPYVWGGESLAEGGMDCSGFVYNALKTAGYDVGRTTAQGYRSLGTSVDKSNLQEGDLIFFGTGDKATHVGIYIGNGQMIHSSGGQNNTKNNPGKGVSITKVDYRSDFLEARRY